MKTNSSAKKRFRRTGTGKIKVRRANRSHILSKVDHQKKRQRRKQGILCKANEKQINAMLGGE